MQETACNAGDLGLIPGLGRSPGEGIGSPPVFLPGKSHGQRSLEGYSPWVCKRVDTTKHTLTGASGICKAMSWNKYKARIL